MNLREALQNARRPRRDVAARATAFTVLLLSCMAALSAAVAYYVHSDLASRQGRETAGQLGSLVRSHAGGIIAGRDEAALARMTQRLIEIEHVTRAVVVDRSGRVVSHAGAAPLRADVAAAVEAIRSGRTVSHERAGDIVSATPALAGEAVAGALVVVMSRASLAHAHLAVVGPILAALLGFLVLAAPVTYFFARSITAPLRALTEFAGQVNAQRLGRQIDIKSGDEFETLANAFNLMMTRLDSSMRRIQQLAFVDPTTQLPNQERFVRELADAIARADAEETQAAVILFDFTRLRSLLETVDSESAQDLMTVVSARLVQAVRTVDRVVRVQSSRARPCIVACMRTNDFAVLAPSVTDPSEAARFAQLINTAMNQPFDWREHKMHLGANCGVAVAPRDGRDADTVMRHAIMARKAARTGGTQFKLFTKALDREAVNRVQFEREMRAALERGEFRAFFQPKINFDTGRIESAEALARWVRQDKSIVGPAKFIPAAEESGLIGAVSDAILREACWKAAAWAREGLPVQVAVNVSALQFRNERFPEHVERTLAHAGLSPHFLELEITESVAMEDPERTTRLIEALRGKGVRFAIDDFGCGHSSLASLTQLPFDVIKIDQQFIRGLERGDKQAPAIVETILAMARALDLTVVAEGVERREEAEFLKASGCRFGQGFLYGAAVSPADFVQMLRDQRQAAAAA